MDKVGKILKRTLAHKGLLGVATSSEICFLAEKWGKGRFMAISYSKGVLKLSVKSSAAAQELQMESEKLVDYLNEKLERQIVKRVRIVNVEGVTTRLDTEESHTGKMVDS